MLKLYDGKIYNIQCNTMTRGDLIHFFLDGDGMNLDSKIAFYEGEELKGVACYQDILYRRELCEKLFRHSRHVFTEVLEYISSMVKPENDKNICSVGGGRRGKMLSSIG